MRLKKASLEVSQLKDLIGHNRQSLVHKGNNDNGDNTYGYLQYMEQYLSGRESYLYLLHNLAIITSCLNIF